MCWIGNKNGCHLVHDKGYMIRTVHPDLNTLLTYWPRPISQPVKRKEGKWYKTKDKYIEPEENFVCRTKYRI